MEMERIVMSDALQFPDHRRVLRERGLAFQRLPADERWRQILDTIETGMTLIRESPHREAIERLYQQKRAESRRIQMEIFKKYGG